MFGCLAVVFAFQSVTFVALRWHFFVCLWVQFNFSLIACYVWYGTTPIRYNRDILLIGSTANIAIVFPGQSGLEMDCVGLLRLVKNVSFSEVLFNVERHRKGVKLCPIASSGCCPAGNVNDSMALSTRLFFSATIAHPDKIIFDAIRSQIFSCLFYVEQLSTLISTIAACCRQCF